MEFEGSTPIAAVVDAPPQPAPVAPAQPIAPPQATREVDAAPGSMIVAKKEEPKKETTKIFSLDDEATMHVAALAGAAVVLVSMPMVRDRLMQYLPMLGNGDMSSFVVQGALVAALVYLAVRFV